METLRNDTVQLVVGYPDLDHLNLVVIQRGVVG